MPPHRWKKPKLPQLLAAPEERIHCLPHLDAAGGAGRGGWRGDGGGAVSVEGAAIEHYKRRGWACGLHCENALFASLFGEPPAGDASDAPGTPPPPYASPGAAETSQTPRRPARRAPSCAAAHPARSPLGGVLRRRLAAQLCSVGRPSSRHSPPPSPPPSPMRRSTSARLCESIELSLASNVLMVF